MPSSLQQNLGVFRSWVASTSWQHKKVIILSTIIGLVYCSTAYPVMRWSGMWPTPIWFSCLLSAVFVVTCFGVSKVRAFGLLLLCPLAPLVSWLQWNYVDTWIYDNFWKGVSNRLLQITMGQFSSYLLGALMLSLLLLLSIVPQRPRLNLIVGFIAFASIQNVISGMGNVMQAGADNWDIYGFNVGAQCFVATVLASLAFERITREPAEK